jgi:hypothetical protein
MTNAKRRSMRIKKSVMKVRKRVVTAKKESHDRNKMVAPGTLTYP